MEKSDKINFLSYKNKISTHNHKISSIKFPELHIVKSLKRSNSNLVGNLSIPINQTILLDENNIKKYTINKYIVENNKQKNKTTKNESILHINEISLIKNEKEKEKEDKKNSYSNNKINHKFYYNIICLGRNSKNELNKVNSPLVKYFLYNISQRNKKQKINIVPLYHNINSNKNNRKKNNLKSNQPNYSLIGKELRKKYNSLKINNNNDNLPNILNNRYSPIVIKDRDKNQSITEDSEGNSSSENNQMNNFIEENILNNEKNKTKFENEIKDYNTSNINASPFKGIDNLKKNKDDFLRIKNKAYYNLKFFKKENKNFYKDLNPNKKSYITLKNISKYLK